MSDGVIISSGGAIEIDSGVLRDIGLRLDAVGRRLVDASDLLRHAAALLGQAQLTFADGAGGETAACAQRLAEAAQRARVHAHGVVLMADTFELVELRAEQEALSLNRPAEAMALQDRIEELIRNDPEIEDRVKMLDAGWRGHQGADMAHQSWDRLLPLLGGFLAAVLPGASVPVRGLGSRPTEDAMRALAAGAARQGRGTLPVGTTLTGAAPPVAVTAVARDAVAAPAGLKDAVQRIPYGRQGQVVVEKYTMPTGRSRFVAYVDGTRSGQSEAEPWDMDSNLIMYMHREQTASQAATLQALEAAGAAPGDQVDLVGYSQGAAIASFTAMSGRYDTGTVITVGNPVEPALADHQTLVRLAHTGDPVVSLAGGGAASVTGSPDSFDVSRTPAPAGPFDPHGFDQYLATAGMADDSGDPRVSRLRETFFAGLADAVAVERTEFRAERM